MANLTRKGYARIYCSMASHVAEVEKVIRLLDSFEADYLPKGLVAPFSEYPNLVYTGKFDGLDMNRLAAECWARDMPVWVLDNGIEQFVEHPVEFIPFPIPADPGPNPPRRSKAPRQQRERPGA